VSLAPVMPPRPIPSTNWSRTVSKANACAGVNPPLSRRPKMMRPPAVLANALTDSQTSALNLDSEVLTSVVASSVPWRRSRATSADSSVSSIPINFRVTTAQCSPSVMVTEAQ